MKLLYFLILVCFISCKKNKIEEQLKGKWILDSAVTIEGRYFDRDFDKTIIFKDNQRYVYTWGDIDVFGKFEGNYYIQHNKNRSTKTILFIPDIDTAFGNDERPSYQIFDIVSLTNDRLEGISDTKRKFNDSDSRLIERINEKYIYKRLPN